MPKNSYEVAVANLSTRLFLDDDKDLYWISVPYTDLQTVVMYAKMKMKEENK